MQTINMQPPPKYVSPKGMWTAKLVLRVTSLVFCLIVGAIGGSIVSNTDIDFDDVTLIIILPCVRPPALLPRLVLGGTCTRHHGRASRCWPGR